MLHGTRRWGFVGRRRLVMALAVLLGSGALGFTSPQVASAATASSCDFSHSLPDSYVCVYVRFTESGGPVKLNSADVIHTHANANTICNYQGVVEIQNGAGEVVKTFKSELRKGCTPVRAYMTVDLKGYIVGRGSAVCGIFYEEGKAVGRTCKKF